MRLVGRMRRRDVDGPDGGVGQHLGKLFEERGNFQRSANSRPFAADDPRR